jgi:hypothetical protein
MYTLEYFDYYCKKNKKIFDILNNFEEKNNFFNSSYVSLERYRNFHKYVIENNYLNNNFSLLDLWCYMGFYIKFLSDIWLQNVYWLDYNKKAILFWNKIWINNLYCCDIRKISEIDIIKENFFDFILILHTFEYMYIKKNGDNFIYETLEESYKKLKKWGKIFLTIWNWYIKYDEITKKNIQFYSEVIFDTNKFYDLWFINVSYLWNEEYLLTK